MAAQAPTNNEFSLQCKQLINVLQKANRETDCALELHQKLAHVYRTKALGGLFGATPASTLRANAHELNELSSALARRLHFKDGDGKGVFSPELLEMLGQLFDQHALAKGKRVNSTVSANGVPQESAAIHWGGWRSQLSADLFLLQSLTSAVLEHLPDDSVTRSEFPALTTETLVLETRDALPPPRPDGHVTGLPDLIVDVMGIYEPSNEVTTDTVRGILRKSKQSA